jgi:hypothetical protein
MSSALAFELHSVHSEKSEQCSRFQTSLTFLL